MRRVLRESGELRFFEHVVAQSVIGATVQRALDATVWPAVGGGCHTSRDTVAAIRGAGFSVEDCERLPRLARHPPLPFVLGRARVKSDKAG